MSVEDRDRDSCETETANTLITTVMMTTMISKLAPPLFPAGATGDLLLNYCVSVETTPWFKRSDCAIQVDSTRPIRSCEFPTSRPMGSRRTAFGIRHDHAGASGQTRARLSVPRVPCHGRLCVRPIVIAIRAITGMMLHVKVTSSSLLY